MLKRMIGLAPLSGLFAVLLSAPAFAVEGSAHPWEIWYQKAASPVMQRIESFHIELLWIITAITVLVLGLLIYCAIRFNAKANPVPSKTTHNTLLEVAWTAIPVLILVIIAVPSFKLLYFMDKTNDPQMTLKVIGHQWYWSYDYPDSKISFDSFLVPADKLKKGQPRLLTVDNPVVLPINTNIQVLGTATDVIHDWAVPRFGIKMDVIPGRINETWVRIEKTGDYYGECSELCGIGHGYMPIHVIAVTKEQYAAWLKTAKQKFASNESPSSTKTAKATGKTPVRVVASAGETAR